MAQKTKKGNKPNLSLALVESIINLGYYFEVQMPLSTVVNSDFVSVSPSDSLLDLASVEQVENVIRLVFVESGGER